MWYRISQKCIIMYAIPKKEDAVEIFDRITKAAEGAAIGTGTTMQFEIIGGTHDLLLNQDPEQ